MELSTAFSNHRANNTMIGNRDALFKSLFMLTPVVASELFLVTFPSLEFTCSWVEYRSMFQTHWGHGRGVLRAPALLGPGKGAQGI